MFLTTQPHSRNGVIAQSMLHQIWRAPAFPPSVHPFLLSLLERFELCFPVTPHLDKLGDWVSSLRSLSIGGENDLLYLIPSILPETPPEQLNELWPQEMSKFYFSLLARSLVTHVPPHTETLESVFGRCYRFEFVPKVSSPAGCGLNHCRTNALLVLFGMIINQGIHGPVDCEASCLPDGSAALLAARLADTDRKVPFSLREAHNFLVRAS